MFPIQKKTELVFVIAVFGLISLMWIPFASPNISAALSILSHAFVLNGFPAWSDVAVLAIVILVGPVASFLGLYERMANLYRHNALIGATCNTLMLVALALQYWRGVDLDDFVYFKF
jgi:hypothetical protein